MMRRRAVRLVPLAGALALAVALGGCGGGDLNALSDTERAMADLDAGRIDLALTAAATADSAPARPVGFRMQGPFAIEDGQRYPTFDLRYTMHLGSDERVIRVVSNGHAVQVVHHGLTTDVPAEQARLLQLGSGDGGFTDLGVAGWVDDPVVVERPDGTRLVTGTIDVADLLSDLARISGQAAGSGDGDALDGDAARRLRRLVRDSDFTAELDPAGLPRSLRAVVDFGRDLPAELRAALGPYASPRLEVTLAVEPADH